MTQFEELCKEMRVPVETDKDGFYKGMCNALAVMVTEIITHDDNKIAFLSWDEQKIMIKEKFYKVFPYMK